MASTLFRGFACRSGYLGDVQGKLMVGQPAFLSGLVEHLPFDDGGYRFAP